MTGPYTYVPLRRFLEELTDGPFGSSLTGSHYSDDGARVIRLGNIGEARFKSEDEAYIPMEYFAELRRHSVESGDLLIAGLGDSGNPVGRACLAPEGLGPAIVKADCFRARLDERRLLHRFAAWALNSRPVGQQVSTLTRGSTRARINLAVAKAIEIPVPSLEEQRRIADYLDRETARIDALVEEQQRLIEMLCERRRVLVTRAVCFGVDGDVELRDSGDPVVGLVPHHWTVKAVRHWMESLDGQRVPLSGEERADRSGDFDYYGASGVIDQVDGYLFDEPLVLVSEDGANLLMRSTPIAFAAKGRYWVNNHAHVLRPRNEGNVDFWAQRLEALDVTTVISGSAQPKLTAGALMGLRVSAPDDADEQRRIVAYLNEQTSKIDVLITESERFVELSRERRAALITAAVTGQIDVRETA
ncbi:restriction endonuclease subunit S [Rhodococcus rhodochrous]|uniref:restriction endonuclease subunit S n=1 Tax=Rhodococcus rhodochrous TaxID=1829 RepID=UPI00188A8C03|nr:restriction endonuclease subunit S [Rhodococcus rhodochrous]MBF4478264.1 restriction endonuclease subunit S [Rhodococcus rhodochrous]